VEGEISTIRNLEKGGKKSAKESQKRIVLLHHVVTFRRSLKQGLRDANWERFHEQMDTEASDLWSVTSQLELRKERAMSMGNKVLRFENGTAGPVQVLEKIAEQRILSRSVFLFPRLKKEVFCDILQNMLLRIWITIFEKSLLNQQ
jgi:hypothetical protein